MSIDHNKVEKCIKSNILSKRSPKGIRGFRWQKRMFRLYHNRIEYANIETDQKLGEIPLVCITKIVNHPESKKTRFNIVLGTFRTFELQSATNKITLSWINILNKMIKPFTIDEKFNHLQQQKDKFWKVYSKDNKLNNNGTINKTISASTLVHSQPNPLTTSKNTTTNIQSTKNIFGKRHRSIKDITSAKSYINDNPVHNDKLHRLSVMDDKLPSKLNEYKILEEIDDNSFNNDKNNSAPYGKVAIVTCDNGQFNNNKNNKNNINGNKLIKNNNDIDNDNNNNNDIDTPYLLHVVSMNHDNFQLGKNVMNIMQNLVNPYIITQLRSGIDNYNTYWALYNFPNNGCLTNCLHLFRNVSITSVRIIIAEIICGLQYLHKSFKLNFPNLSPETIYISHKNHIVLTDFGFAIPKKYKIIYRTGPLCYAPPEFLSFGSDDIISDSWRLGVLIYHLLKGKPPFVGSRDDVCNQICQDPITKDKLFKDDKDSEKKTSDSNDNDSEPESKEEEIPDTVKNLILGLLNRDKIKRKTLDDIKKHQFFQFLFSKKSQHKSIKNWKDIELRKHNPAPILAHLGLRITDSPRENDKNTKLNKPEFKFDDKYTDTENEDDDDDDEYENNGNNSDIGGNNNNSVGYDDEEEDLIDKAAHLREPKVKKNKNKVKKADNWFTDKMRTAVSKKKRRFIDKNHGFNLDLTYITERIIAMGFPSFKKKEQMYRNPLSEVRRFFKTFHADHFKVYNLCIEKDRQYDGDKNFGDIGGLVTHKYQFKDHNSPELELIMSFCQDVHEFLNKNKKNVVAIHCKAGKGRTGVMICSYLVYSKICKSAFQSLKKYGESRTKNAKGVTIPSQRRYVYYFSNYVLSQKPNPNYFQYYQIVILKKIKMNTIPNFDAGGGCDPYFLILNTNGEILYDYSQHNSIKSFHNNNKKDKNNNNDINNDNECVKFTDLDIILRGSFKLIFYDKDIMSSDDIMCWAWLHSGICAKEGYIFLDRDDIDGAVKDKKFKKFNNNFSLEFWFVTPPGNNPNNTLQINRNEEKQFKNSINQKIKKDDIHETFEIPQWDNENKNNIHNNMIFQKNVNPLSQKNLLNNNNKQIKNFIPQNINNNNNNNGLHKLSIDSDLQSRKSTFV